MSGRAGDRIRELRNVVTLLMEGNVVSALLRVAMASVKETVTRSEEETGTETGREKGTGTVGNEVMTETSGTIGIKTVSGAKDIAEMTRTGIQMQGRTETRLDVAALDRPLRSDRYQLVPTPHGIALNHLTMSPWGNDGAHKMMTYVPFHIYPGLAFHS